MLLLAAAVLTAAPPSTVGIALPKLLMVKTPDLAAVCPRDVRVTEADGQDGARVRKLNELPPAKMYIAVVHQDEKGCLSPIIVKYDIGR